MRVDPVARLVALHVDDANIAKELLFCREASGALTAAQMSDLIERAVAELFELVEAAICGEVEDLTITVSTAELIAIALKGRILPRGRPRMTARQRTLRAATILFARNRSKELRANGVRAGKADETAAKEAAVQGGLHGDVAAWTTILAEVKGRSKKVTG